MKELPEPWEEAYGEAIPLPSPNPDTRFFCFRANRTAITTKLRAINMPTMAIATAPPVDIPPLLFVPTFAPLLGLDVLAFAVGSSEDTDGTGAIRVVPLTVELLGAAGGGGTGLTEEDELVGGEVETVGEGELLGG